jgi:hypothetical protein
MGDPLQSEPRAARETPPSAGSTEQPPTDPWLVRGIEDVYHQREAQIGWWTVLGGIAVGALLTQLSDVVAQARAGRWSLVLYFVAAALVIVLSWVQTTWGTLVLKWPISIPNALLGFLSGLAQSILSLQVTNPCGWMFAACLVAVGSVLVQLYFARSGAWAGFSPAYAARLRGMVWTHGAFGGIALAAGLLLLRYPGRLHETLWGLIALAMAVAALWLQDQGMKSERAALGIP